MEDTAAAQESLQNGSDCGLQLAEDELRERKDWDLKHVSRDQKGWRKVIRNFTPS